MRGNLYTKCNRRALNFKAELNCSPEGLGANVMCVSDIRGKSETA